MMTTLPMPTAGDLIETFPIRFADGREYEGTLYRTSRHRGRRVLVRDASGGAVLFDTDDCYDVSNAAAKLDNWIATVE